MFLFSLLCSVFYSKQFTTKPLLPFDALHIFWYHQYSLYCVHLGCTNSTNKSGLYCDRYIYCEKCFNDIKGDEVELNDDPTQPLT